MARAGPRKVHKYSTAFKLTAVRMSAQPGMQMKSIAAGWTFTLSCCHVGARMCAMASCAGACLGKPRPGPPASSGSSTRSSARMRCCRRSATS